MKTFKKICKKNQMELEGWLYKLLKAKYKNVVAKDGFLYAKGDGKSPVLLTAHMDTVHKEKCREIVIEKENGETVISSPQGIGGDDRCGIWIIWMILTKTKYRPSILFCEDEEIGGVGSSKFVKTSYIEDFEDLKYLIELDRCNANDAVYYDCGNEKFKKYIKDSIGYKEAYGSFSDISHLSPECDKASVNLSVGYYSQHTLKEFVIFEEMFESYKAVKKLLAEAKEVNAFDYEEATYDAFEWGDYYGDNYGYNYYGYGRKKAEIETYEIVYNDTSGKTGYYLVDAVSYEEAVGTFLIENSNLTFGAIIDLYVAA